MRALPLREELSVMETVRQAQHREANPPAGGRTPGRARATQLARASEPRVQPARARTEGPLQAMDATQRNG